MARYRQIAETLEEGIRRGDYVSRLPSVRLLGELFQANSRTVLRALRELSAAGLIVPNGNQGFRIGPQGGGRPETGNIAVFSTGMFQPTGRWNREFQRQFESAGKRLVAIAAPDRGLFAGGKFWETLEVDGVIFLQSSLDRDAAYRLKLSGIPFVAANRMPREWGVNSVDFDHERALRSFLTALVRRGHRRIAILFHGISPFRIGGYLFVVGRNFVAKIKIVEDDQQNNNRRQQHPLRITRIFVVVFRFCFLFHLLPSSRPDNCR